MQAVRAADAIYIAAFVNLSAVCRELAPYPHLHIVCAGTEGEITREDVLLAGAIVDLLEAGTGAGAGTGTETPLELNDQAQIAADAWQEAKAALTATSLSQRLRASRGGRNVLRLGQENDIDIAATLDKFDLAPRLDPKTWEIR